MCINEVLLKVQLTQICKFISSFEILQIFQQTLSYEKGGLLTLKGNKNVSSEIINSKYKIRILLKYTDDHYFRRTSFVENFSCRR